jgi:hypothetical protein
MTTTTHRPATEKQVAFVRTLIGQVCSAEIALDPENGPEAALALEQGIEEAIELNEFALTDASATIERLKARLSYLRAKGACAAAKAPKSPLVDVGFYYADGTVYRVVPNQAKTSRYAKRLNFATGQWNYAAGVIGRLTAADALTTEQAAALGHQYDRCVCCGAELSDPDSVARGIGPVCAKRLQNQGQG